jgi:hypothetical protein
VLRPLLAEEDRIVPHPVSEIVLARMQQWKSG